MSAEYYQFHRNVETGEFEIKVVRHTRSVEETIELDEKTVYLAQPLSSKQAFLFRVKEKRLDYFKLNKEQLFANDPLIFEKVEFVSLVDSKVILRQLRKMLSRASLNDSLSNLVLFEGLLERITDYGITVRTVSKEELEEVEDGEE